MALPALSPYSRQMNEHMVQKVSGFLRWRESLASYSCVHRSHRMGVIHGLPKVMTIPSHLVNRLFENIGKFRKLNDLTIDCSRVIKLIIPHGTGGITKLSFKGWITTPEIMMFLEAISNLKRLSFSHKPRLSVIERFRPIAEERLTEAASHNLTALTELHLNSAYIDPQGVCELLQHSKNFTSVTIKSQRISNALLTALKLMPMLSQLNLSYVKGEVDYKIISGCKSLKSLTLTARIAENALNEMIEVNKNLTLLDLSYVTDDTLKVVGTSLPKLLTLRIDESKVSDFGFIPLIRGCPELISLNLSNAHFISPQALLNLRNCSKLEDLRLMLANLSDDFLATLATMRRLIKLDLTCGSGFQKNGMVQLHSLTTLKLLNLEGTKGLTDAEVLGFINHCPKLQIMRISGSHPLLTEKIFVAIRAAIVEHRTDLWVLSGLKTHSNFFHTMCEKLNKEFTWLKIS